MLTARSIKSLFNKAHKMDLHQNPSFEYICNQFKYDTDIELAEFDSRKGWVGTQVKAAELNQVIPKKT